MRNNTLIRLKEKFFPEKIPFEIFNDLGTPHHISAQRYAYPFTHVSIPDFLPPADFQKLTELYEEMLSRGTSETHDSEKFSRFDMYDLYSYMPQPDLKAPQRFFYSESYFQMLETLFGPLSRDTFLTFHHHELSARDNYVHTDFVFGCFADDPLPNGVNAWFKQCHHTQKSTDPAVRTMTRAVAVIFYLDNAEWQKELGGETGIFTSTDPHSLVRALPPVNNTLTAFEITPSSFHNFMKNNSPSRNSIAQWFFITPEETKKRFPTHDIGDWSSSS